MGFKTFVKRVFAHRATQVAGIVIIIAVVFTGGVLVGNGRLTFNTKQGMTGLPKTLDYSELNALYSSLRENYAGTLTTDQIMDGLKHGLADAPKDPYTEYFTPTEAKAFNSSVSGQTLTGIGAQLDEDSNGNVVVMSPIDGSPAAAAGVKAKDIIATIDGKSTAGMTVNDAVDKIRGKKGTKVTLGIVRGNQALTLTITRDTIDVPNVTSKVLDGNVGYIQVSQFGDVSNTYDVMAQDVDKLKQQGVKKMILDLRDNPGGEVDTAVDISSLWLPDNAVVMQQKGTDNETYRSTGVNPLKGMSTVVLVNGGSASAAEITALALHDSKAAYIIGEKSYGKGVVQSRIQFGDGSELKVTVAKWYSPTGKNINHTGITPDKIVKEPADATKDNDPQLMAAQSYLSTK